MTAKSQKDLHEALAAKARRDSWESALTGLGTTRDKTTTLDVTVAIPMSEAQLEALYMGDDLAATIVDSVPEDALSKGVTITGASADALTQAFEAQGGAALFVDAWTWGRLHGGGAIFMGCADPDQSKPLDPQGHGRLLYTMVLDRWEMQVATYYTNNLSPRYGQPRTYRITPKNEYGGGQPLEFVGKEVHESRLIVFGGARTSKRFKARNGGWDASFLQRAQYVLRDYAGFWRSTAYAVADLSQAVFKLQGLVEMIAEGKKDELLDRMELVDMARSVARAVVLDAEMEEFEVVGSANLSAVPTILDKASTRVAAAARMPLTRLMGTSPGGLNATGESDLSWWYGVIDVARELEAKPRLLRFLRVLGRSLGVPTDDLDVDFPALWSLSDLEQATLRNTVATTDVAYINAGVLLPEEVALSRYGSGTWSAETTVDLAVPRDAGPPPAVPGVPDFAAGSGG